MLILKIEKIPGVTGGVQGYVLPEGHAKIKKNFGGWQISVAFL